MSQDVLTADRLVGTGAMGSVYKAHDSEGKVFALKVLAQSSPTMLSMFEEEVRILSKLKHPGLVEVSGFSRSGEEIKGLEHSLGVPSFWMEFVEGEPILEAARKVGPDKIVSWLKHALEALDYLHRQGILHGDLKPANVLIDEKGHLRFVDFGLASLTENRIKGNGPGAQGTLPYMAPETVDGERLPASDLFALGTVFYQALSGRHPRQGAKDMKSLFSPEVMALKELCPSLPSFTARVIERMIAPDLSLRLKTAGDALETLTQEKEEAESEGGNDSLHSFQMFGVEEAWSRFFDFLKKIHQENRRGIVLLHGITGVGRTRFLREILFQLALQGMRVFESRPFLGRPLLPVVSDTFSVTILSGAEELLSNHIKELYLFLRSKVGAPSLVVLEYNDEKLKPSHVGFFSSLAHEESVMDLTLHNLDEKNTEFFLKTLFKKTLPQELAQALYDRTQGNPKLLTEFCREIFASGLLGKKRLKSSDLFSLGLSKTTTEIFEDRLNRQGPEERELLLLLALARSGAKFEDLQQLTGQDVGRLRLRLQGLLHLGLLRMGRDETYQIASAPLAPLLLGKVSPLEILSLHERWLQVLEKKITPEGGGEGELFLDLAHHVLEVKAHPRRIEWVLKAGEEFTLRGDDPSVIAFYEKCLSLSPDPAAEEFLFRMTANAYGRLGRFAESSQWIERWFEKYPSDPFGLNAVKYWLVTGLAFQNLGDLAEAHRRFEKCLTVGDLKSDHHRPYLARAYSLLGLLDLESENHESAALFFKQALELTPPMSEERAEVFKHQALLAVQKNNWDEALLHLKEAETMFESLANGKGLFSIALERGNLALRLGRIEEVEGAYGEALAVASKNRDDASLARVYQNFGVIACRKGEFDRALNELEKAREVFVFLGSPYERGVNLLQLALAHASVGHFKRAEDFLLQALEQKDPSVVFLHRRQEVEFQIGLLREGDRFLARHQKVPFQFDEKEPPDSWDREQRLLRASVRQDPQGAEEVRSILHEIYQILSDPLKITFEDRADYQKWICQNTLSSPRVDLPQTPSPSTLLRAGFVKRGERVAPSPYKGEGGGRGLPDEGEKPIQKEKRSMDALQKLTAITREILSSTNLDQVLVRLMDAAMELSNAERGFLVIRSENSQGPLPGFEVKVARNVVKELLESQDFTMSLSAVREAMKTGEVVVTDNALQDQRFEAAPSVHKLELKSILALPLKGTKGIIGALYLDHRYETNIFTGADLNLLQMFADQAALGLQKAQMIEELQNANQNLSQTVEVQASEISSLKREVEDQREILTHEYKEIVGQSPPMLEVLSLVDRVTETKVPVWIYGESGTGKEMIARCLHFNSSRAKKPFVSENCSALPETLLESELFGHKKGAFTHADRDKKGLIEYAQGGTIFLDEIADMSGAMQAKLLRFLQEGEIRPLGSNEIIKVDVRVVSASNKDLQVLITEEKFREDLFYRLNGVTVALPPLRDRMEDLPLLAQHFLKKSAKDEKRDPYEITPEALELLMEYPWPGNVRELENTLRTASLFHQKGKIVPKSFNFKKVLLGGAGTSAGVQPAPTKRPGSTVGAHGRAPGAGPAIPEEKRLLLKALYDNSYHKGLAAETLGISRRYLYTQMMKHGVPVNRVEMKSYIEQNLGMK